MTKVNHKTSEKKENSLHGTELEKMSQDNIGMKIVVSITHSTLHLVHLATSKTAFMMLTEHD